MKPSAKTKVTDEQRAKLDAALKFWQDELNLRDWRVEFSHRLTRRKNVLAEAHIDMGAKLASIRVGALWPKDTTDKNIDELACHESLHVFLRPLIDAAREGNEDAIEAAEHSIINVLERLLAR